jgi:hypothetical protein
LFKVKSWLLGLKSLTERFFSLKFVLKISELVNGFSDIAKIIKKKERNMRIKTFGLSLVSIIVLSLYAYADIKGELLSNAFLGAELNVNNKSEPDSLNCRFIGNWPFSYARAVSYDNVRRLVFLGSGGGVYILNVLNPQKPLVVSEAIHTRGIVYGLFYLNNRLYIADGVVGLEIWDVTNPSAPTKLGAYNTPGHACAVYVLDNYAYVADASSGLRIINISDLSSPTEIGYYDTPGSAYGVYIIGNYAYVADRDSGLRVIDISDPSSPTEIGYYDTPGSAYDVYVTGDYAYVADGDSGLRVIDISDPSSPTEIGYYDTPGSAYGVYVLENHVYVADYGENLRIIDISDPSLPTEIGYYDTWGFTYDVYVVDGYAYIADHYNGLRIINVSTPSSPNEVGFYKTPGVVRDIYVSGSHAYLVGDLGLYIINVSNPSLPWIVGYYEGGAGLGVHVIDNYAYVAVYDGLKIINISNPQSPYEVGFCSTPGGALGVYVSGGYAYVAAGYYGVRIIKVSNPSSPTEVGFYDTPGMANGVYVSGDYAYVADMVSGLRVIRVSSPSSPTEVGYYDTPGWARGVYVSGNYAYVADGLRGLRVVDVTYPPSPVEIGYYDTPGHAYDVYVLGNYAYVADGNGGIRIINISNPFSPHEVGYYNTPADAYGVCGFGNYVFVANTNAGLQVYYALITIPSWVQEISISTQVLGKYVKDGGALVSTGSTLFAFRGNKSNEFYEYAPLRNFWSCKESIPFGYKPGTTTINSKKVSKGAALCYDGDSLIYATKGNGTYEFWKYDILNDTWILLPYVPTIKGLKGGTSIAYHDGYVYLLAGGQKQAEHNFFFRYSVSGDSWEVLTKPQVGAKDWKDGSAIVAYGNKIYAMKGGDKPNYFLTYDITQGSWNIGSYETLTTFDSIWTGTKWATKALYVKDGGALAKAGDALYAIKGGGVNTFYKYTPTTKWVQLVRDTIPRLHKKSVPKTGAALAYLEPYLYLLKGNNTPEFWRYGVGGKIASVKPSEITSVMTEKTASKVLAKVDVVPNPLTGSTTVRYVVPTTGKVSLKLYDASGRVVSTIYDGHQESGVYSLSLNASTLARGVYFLRYETQTDRLEVKLIVE